MKNGGGGYWTGINQGTNNNDKIINDLRALLNNAGFVTEIQLGIFPRTDISKSWEIHTLSTHVPLIQQILSTIKPYMNPNYGLARRDSEQWIKFRRNFPENEIHIFINTSPIFNNNGQVVY